MPSSATPAIGSCTQLGDVQIYSIYIIVLIDFTIELLNCEIRKPIEERKTHKQIVLSKQYFRQTNIHIQLIP